MFINSLVKKDNTFYLTKVLLCLLLSVKIAFLNENDFLPCFSKHTNEYFFMSNLKTKHINKQKFDKLINIYSKNPLTEIKCPKLTNFIIMGV